jgi:ABC-type sugar transport system ATPase subunit
MASTSLSPTLLSITGANKSYSGVSVLVDAALDLRAGEVHALMGENGAGKSTLIKLLAGVVHADAIQISIRGQPVTVHHAQAAFDLGLRFIHQELNIVPQLSVAENIFLSHPYPTHAGFLVRWRKLNQQARQVLGQLGVDHIDTQQLMARLSPGDQMLVSIARAFMDDETRQASIYVMDEPTASLSGEETVMLFRVIESLKRRGSAILYVSHRMDEIFKIADRITIMRDGRVVDTRAVETVEPADIIRMMTGRALQQTYPPREMDYGSRILLEARGLRTAAVSDVTFELLEGQILGVAGLNGSGRTELLRALMGADRILDGEIVLDGLAVRGLSPKSAWQHGITYVPEERRSQGLVLSRSVSNNITLPQLRHLSRAGILLHHGIEYQASQKVGDSVRLKAKSPAQTVRQLSGGNQQKVVFARALTRLPRVMLLDEPTRGVDVGAKADIYALIRQISAAGTGIIMVSSDLPELLGLSDRILVMRAGRMADQIAAEGLTEESLLTLCYGAG